MPRAAESIRALAQGLRYVAPVLQAAKPVLKRLAVFVRDNYPILALGVYLLVSTRKLYGGAQFAFGDLEPVPPTAAAAWHEYFRAWSTHDLGFPGEPQFYHLLEAAMLAISFNRAVLVEHLLVGLVLPLALVGAFLLLRFLGLPRGASAVGAVIFALNPATLGEMLGGTELSTLAAIALLPFTLMSLLGLWRTPTPTRVVASAALLGTEVQLSYVEPAILAGMSALLLCDVVIRRPAFRVAARGLGAMILAAVAATLFAAPILAASSFIYPTHGGENITLSATSVAGFMADVRYTYSFTALESILRLGGVGGAEFAAGQWHDIFGYTVAVWLAVGVGLMFRGKWSLPLLSGLILSLVALGFVAATHYGLTYSIFARYPLLFVLRNPVQPVMIAALGVALVAGAVTEAFMRDRRMRWTGLALVFAYGVYVAIPSLSGDYMISSRSDAQIPSSYLDIIAQLQEMAPDGYYRVLWLPGGYEQVTAKTRQLPVNIVEVRYGAAQFYVLHGDAYLQSAFSEVAAGESRRLGALIAPYLGLFVVVDMSARSADGLDSPNVTLPYGTPYLTGSGEQLYALCARQEDLRLLMRSAGFAVFLNLALLR